MCTDKGVNPKFGVSWGVERKDVGKQLWPGWQEVPARIRGWRFLSLSSLDFLSLPDQWPTTHKNVGLHLFKFTKLPLLAYVYVRGSLCLDRRIFPPLCGAHVFVSVIVFWVFPFKYLLEILETKFKEFVKIFFLFL